MTPPEGEESFKVTDRRRREEEPASGREGPAAERSLVALFMMLGSSALIALGEAPDPATGERRLDLGNVAEVIDLLILLRERTEGRRLAEETSVLEQLVYDLQLRYVSATRRSG
ncbi:MAG: DUF1844 domain-containing protein [Candidatus Rokuibacteriota bacterium]